MTFSDSGTRVRLYPQPPSGTTGAELETVELSSPVGSLGPGPSDDRMYAVIPIGKTRPYGRPAGYDPADLYLPPWTGPRLAPPQPSPEGHFDHVPVTDPTFRAVHLFGATRFTLDVWETYLGARIPWHFEQDFPRIELSMVEDWENAHMGYGFLQTGTRFDKQGRPHDYALNFDVIAHEVGHAILLSLTGPLRVEDVYPDFLAFHEMSSDWVALIASLHFDSVVEDLLENTAGNLDSFNRLSRFGEISSSEQIRMANNDQTMRDVAGGWRDEHKLALPLIGAFFDTFVDIYHELLLQHGAVSEALERLADRAEREPALRAHVQRNFDRAFDRHPEAFRSALLDARDIIARFLMGIWQSIDQRTFVFDRVPPLMHNIDTRLTHGKLAGIIDNNFGFRGIGTIPPGPRTHRPGANSHSHSARMLVPKQNSELNKNSLHDTI